MNKQTYLFLGALLIWSCAGTTDRSEKNNAEETAESVSPVDSLRILENKVGDIDLPLVRKDMLPELRRSLKSFTITRELGEFEYGEAPVYTVKYGEENVGLFEMDMTDTLKLNNLYLRSYAKDMYGLGIGDNYTKLKTLRGDSVKHYTDFHQHTYVVVENSNIMYEIGGPFPDDTDLSNPSFTEEQISHWTIEEIIWRTYPGK